MADTELEGPTGETSSQKYKRWQNELEQAKKWFRKFQQQGEKTNKAYLGEKTDQDAYFDDIDTQLNLFHSNITTLTSMLYGRIPKVDVARRFADPEDDISRVAALILQRILNQDIEVAGEDMASVFRNGLQDRLLPGLGVCRVQYRFREEEKEKPAITDPTTGIQLAPSVTETVIADEWTDIVYTHWKDVLWSPARTHGEIRWKAYRSFFDKGQFKARFPECDLTKVSFSSKGPMNTKYKESGAAPTPQAEVWEIWSKDEMYVCWITDGYEEILDEEEDPLELEGFWPDAPPLMANVTTQKFLPKADYMIARDLYREIDELETRITVLTRACKAVGVYDKQNPDVQRIFDEAIENQLVPVENWAMFSEKGGLDGSIDWVPIKEIAEVINVLTEKQMQKISQLFQVTGMNDIMRGGQMSEQRVSATQRRLEANYGSIRIEALQNEFARWVSDTQSLKAEIICKHYQPYCIKQQSNIMLTTDAEWADKAIELLKSPGEAQWRITVRPETLAIADYAQLKQDRTEFLFGVSQFLQSSAPLIEAKPEAAPYLMQMLKWGMAGFRGASEIEGVMDKGIAAMEKGGGQQKPDPEAQKAQLKMQEIQMGMKADAQKHQQEMAQDAAKFQQEMQQRQQEFTLKLEEMNKKFQLEMTQLLAELKAAQKEQQMQFAYNTAEREHEKKVSVEQANAEARADNGSA